MKEIEAIVSGRVQGVNFRNFVKKKADALWLSGVVENIPGYKVRVIAQGPEDKLKELTEYLHKGPFHATVSNVDVAWQEPKDKMQGFKVIY